jgi:adenylate cyclase
VAVSFFEELKRRNVVRVGIAYGVATWLLIQVTDIVFPRIGLPDSAVTLVIALLFIGFIPTLIIAWAFEMTPEGIKREKDVDRAESSTPKTAKKLDKIIIAGLILVIFGMGVERAWFAGNEKPTAQATTSTTETAVLDQAKTIAVLPFADMSESQDQAWFSDGLAEEILNALARAPDLLVSSRTSSFAYKGSNTPISQIATDLGVAHVLEGSVRRAGDRIRVTAQLIRASDGFHLWSENYDRNADDIITIQEELAVSIAKALKTTMDPDALKQMLSAGTRSVDAFEHYLNGLSLEARAWDEPGWESILRAYDEFEMARNIDPEFSSAHMQSSRFWTLQISISRRGSGLTDLSPQEMMSAYRERIGRAIETAGNKIDRQKSEAQLALVEMRVRDAIRLATAVLKARPYDVYNVEVLHTASEIANDHVAMELALIHSYSLWGKGPEWLREVISGSYRAKFFGVPAVVDMAEFLPRAIAASGKASPAYQAHRALLWIGEVEKAAGMLPYLAAETDEARAIIDFRQACAEGRRSDADRILANLPKDWTPELHASTAWHMYQALERFEDAANALKPFESIESPLTLGAYLGYPDFDPTPFPVVQSIMQREGIKRPPPAKNPFACPDEDVIQQESVAVLPFTSMSSGEDDGYFADGLTEEILNSLASLPELLVTARTSSFHFKDKNLPVQEIAATLGVNHIVEGSVRRSGEQVRITAQLIRAEDGFHLWSDTYDRTLEDVFTVQEEIATRIAETLDVVLNDDKRHSMRVAGIGDVEAFIAYQKAMEAFAVAHSIENPYDGLEEANMWFDHALSLAPEIGIALYLRTDLFGHLVYDNGVGRKSLTTAELQTAMDEILSSLTLAIRASDQKAKRAMFDAEKTLFEDNWTSLPAKIDAAFQSNDCTPTNWVTSPALSFGWAEEVVIHGRNLLRCDPLNSLFTWTLTQEEIWAGNPEEGLAVAEYHLENVGYQPWVDDARFLALQATGKYRDDPTVYESNPEGSTYTVPRRIFVHALDNEIETAREVLNEFLLENPVDDVMRIIVEASLGDREAANAIASRIDSRFAGPFLLMEVVKNCYCGAPFDLEATPNFKARLDEAGFVWPPSSPLDFPAKDW